ncbi:protein kinase [Ramlibacter sp.]|uniref:protein kinase domain-containing protein n=1 Tax=Ramlibacter sp. TaxID=1917967 RepID=UPI0035B490A7
MEVLRKLGRYDLVRILGKGAMGVVYEGLDPSLGRRVAVKTILRNAAGDPETERTYAQRFAQEARAVARLNHPHIVQVYDFGVEDDVAYLVMEFIDGRELRSLFESGERLPLAEVVRLMGELLDALDFAHEAGVIHRDVKPANVMLDAQRRLKLADFGVARVQDGTQRTQADTMVGSPAYMSPEQISGARIDRRTDIFAAGIVLHQFLTGDKPFKGDTPWAVLAAIAQEQPPPPSSLVPGLPAVFDTVVAGALAKDPAARYPTAKAFAAALRAALAGHPAEMPTVFPAAAVAARAPAAVAPPPVAATSTSDAELEFWRSVQSTVDPAELEAYIAQFPNGTYSTLARVKLSRMRAVPGSPADVTMPPVATARPATTQAVDEPPRRGSSKALLGAGLGAVALVAGAAIWWGRAPAPAATASATPPAPQAVAVVPVASAPAAPVAPAPTPAVDEQARRALAAASQAAADRAAAEKAAARAAAEREQTAREARRAAEDKLAAEKAAAAAAAERAAAERVAAERAAAERAAAEQASAQSAARSAAEALAARAKERRAAATAPASAPPPAAPAAAATEARFFANEDTDWGVAPTREPRVKPLHAPTPRSLPGGRTIATLDLKALLLANRSVVVIDVLDTKARMTVPGAAWMPGAGQGRLGPPAKAGFANALQELTGGDRGRPLVFLCLNAECWLSYNAALHAIEAGYTQVHWYRGGTDAWTGAGLPRRAPRRIDW